MKAHQLKRENVSPRQLAHAMLGLRYWLPRGENRFSTDAEQVLSGSQQTIAASSKPAAVLPQSRQYADVADTPQKERATAHAQISAEKITLASGVELTGHGTMVYDQAVSYAWFFPLPWRQNQSWNHWRDESEMQLLENACASAGLDDCLMLLHLYQAQKFEFLSLPEKEVSPLNVALPSSIKEIITFSGLTWLNLTGQSQSEDSVMIDWHGREVRVRCLPHPYCCLIEPNRKRALWQGLIKLKYET
ncbi:hypothetical protein KRX19_04295 [Cardiobacteriaceae bacterium TAE3-ERU3]|nr:hypothetical protein [Cardiobacteriaceae bacterium TAE3-ERU3]